MSNSSGERNRGQRQDRSLPVAAQREAERGSVEAERCRVFILIVTRADRGRLIDALRKVLVRRGFIEATDRRSTVFTCDVWNEKEGAACSLSMRSVADELITELGERLLHARCARVELDGSPPGNRLAPTEEVPRRTVADAAVFELLGPESRWSDVDGEAQQLLDDAIDPQGIDDAPEETLAFALLDLEPRREQLERIKYAKA